MRALFTATILLGVLYTQAQQAAHLRFDNLVAENSFDKQFNVIPIYRYSYPYIEEFTDAYTGEKLPQFAPILPNLRECTDTAYGYLFFSGCEKTKSKGYVLMVIGNAQSVMPPTLFIDFNFNHDLTDDGPGVELPFNRDSIEFYLKNAENPEGYLKIRLSRFRLQNQFEYKKNLTEYFNYNAGSKRFISLNNSYRIQYWNILASDYKSEKDSFRLGLCDENLNGIYNEKSVDKVVIGNYGSPTLSHLEIDGAQGIKSNSEKHEFVRNGIAYSLFPLQEANYNLYLEEKGVVESVSKLLEGKKAPRIEFDLLVRGNSLSLKAFRKKPLYLFFWNISSLNDTDKFYLKKLDQDFGKKINIVALNYGDEPIKIKDYISKDMYMWTNGLSNKRINMTYGITNLPDGFFIKKRLRIEKSGLNPKAAYTHLTQKN